MNATENNKKLAEFLGVKPLHNDWFDGYELHKAGLPFNYGAMGNGTSVLKFNTSWDWLMVVVDKIEETETIDGRTFTVDMYGDSVIINQYGKYNNEIIVTEGGTRIENLYKACIKFVEWWNQQNN